MHPNPAFRQSTTEVDLGFARERGFGVLSVNGTKAPLFAHVPFLVDPSGDHAELHLVRSNPIARMCKDALAAAIVVNGADSYVSPDWYEMEDQVPTWNYIAIHIRGTLTRLDDGALRGVLDRLSQENESRLRPKSPWTADKMKPEILARMMRSIQPFRFDIAEVQSTWKLGQNKPEDARRAAATEIGEKGFGAHPEEISRLMSEFPQKR